MVEIISLEARRAPVLSLRALRSEYGLTVVQAAAALETSPSCIEDWECGNKAQPSYEYIRNKFDFFISKNPSASKNLVFGTYPLRVAREILQLSIGEMAAKFGYKESTWRKIEADYRRVDRDILFKLEDEMKNYFLSKCRIK